MPASTQWDVVQARAKHVGPVFDELLRQAAGGEVVFNDDTTVKILELMGKRAQQRALAAGAVEGGKQEKQRKRLFTSGIVSTGDGHRIALFFSGRKHAGENLQDVLAERAKDLGTPIQMCDALSRNLPTELETIVANCLAHGRRQFVEVAELHAWFTRQFEDRLVEPNSSLGGAIAYMLRHWEKLTLFLRVPGAPLDNNLCERALKKAILHRKNALFYKSTNGAHVGDVFMSLIYTCELCGANPLDYLTELERHAVKAFARLPEGHDLAGWVLDEATGASNDGTVIVGTGRNPSGQREAWKAVIPEPSSLLLLSIGSDVDP